MHLLVRLLGLKSNYSLVYINQKLEKYAAQKS